MPAWPSVLLMPEIGELTDDVRQLFQELESANPPSAVAGQCNPALDVLETDETIEIVMDLPGVRTSGVRVLLKGNVVVIAGEKVPAGPDTPCDYHLVERGSGRFARAVRVSTAFDGGRAEASLAAGELRVVLPKIHDRRDEPRPLAITTDLIGHEC